MSRTGVARRGLVRSGGEAEDDLVPKMTSDREGDATTTPEPVRTAVFGNLRSLTESSVGELLDAFAERTPAPGGGAAAALALAVAAALCAMAGRFSDGHLGSAATAAIAARADESRARALELAIADAAAYTAVIRARRLPADKDPALRVEALAAAMADAVAVPREIAALASEVALIAKNLATGGNPHLRGDAVTARLLAEAAAAAAGQLVEINLSAQSS